MQENTLNESESSRNLSTPEIETSKYQIFHPQKIDRKYLKEAPYNPRFMDEHSRKLLKKSVKEGLADTIVWNKRTGYVVGGHQRLSVLDELQGNQNYALDVLVIDVDEKKEREINIRLNNENMMGAYDSQKLADMFINQGVQFSEAGFSSLDIKLAFDTPVANEILGIEKEEEPEVKEDVEKIKELKERRKKGKETANTRNEGEFFKVIVFNSMQSMDEFCNHFGVDNLPRYIDGEVIKSQCGIPSGNDEK